MNAKSQKEESATFLSPKLGRVRVPNSLEPFRMESEANELVRRTKNVIVGNVLLAATSDVKNYPLDATIKITEDDEADVQKPELPLP
jgi:hypothetical protein